LGIFPEQHEALIEQELFDLVQKRLGVRKRQNKWNLDNVFQGIVKCSDCGSSLGLSKNSHNGIFYLCCYKYRRYSKENRCTMHYIPYPLLYDLVLAEIRENIAVVTANEHCIEEFINKSLAKNKVKIRKAEDTVFEKLNRRKDELDKMIERLFEGSALNSLSTERFHEMLAKYETERREVVSQLDKMKTTVTDELDGSTRIRNFFQIMKKYKGKEKLTATMVNELIDKIVVHESNGRKKNRVQQVDIHYKFIDEGLAKSPEN
jgi:hypothetical protein